MKYLLHLLLPVKILPILAAEARAADGGDGPGNRIVASEEDDDVDDDGPAA